MSNTKSWLKSFMFEEEDHTQQAPADNTVIVKTAIPVSTAAPGSHIKHNYNLVDMDLAWHENINTEPRFLALTSEIKGLFKSL